MLPQEKLSINDKEGLNQCFACGKDNPIGLKLNFRWDGGTVRAEFTPDQFHQGWPGRIHGGIINTLLDEAMSYVPYFQGLICVTARMTVRFRRPAPAGEPLLIEAAQIRKIKKLLETRAKVTLKDGSLVAEGTASMFILDKRQSI